MSGVSRGTESLVFRGKIPESEWARMRCPFQEGDFPFPVKYGYAMAAQVDDDAELHAGRRIFCLHPHQTRFTIPAAAAIPIPDDVPTQRSVLAPQVETAINAIWDGGAAMGQRIAVVGAGAIGCLVAWLCARMPGADVTLIDRDPARRGVAARLGVAFALAGDAAPFGCDLVFHASGSADGLALALSLAGFEALIVELSWHGADPIPVSLGGAFHSQRLTIRSSQVGAVSGVNRPRWDFRRRLSLALALCADPALDALVEDETQFDDLPDRMPAILAAPGALCHRIRY
jgi:threonine dehydrogenase-like Zn-dependent dehydrogenase